MTFDEHKALAEKIAALAEVSDRKWAILEALREAYYQGRMIGAEEMHARAQQVIRGTFT